MKITTQYFIMETKLATICEHLLHNKYPRDDTLIEKLISSLVDTSLHDMLQAFSEEVNGSQLMATSATDINKIQPDCLAAFVRIIGVASVRNFKALNRSHSLISFFKICMECSTTLQEKSVTHAVLSMFKMIVCSESGLNFHKEEVYISFIKFCMEDSSLFIAKLAAEVIGVMLMYDLNLSQGSEHSVVDICAENIPLVNANNQENSKQALKDKAYLQMFTYYVEKMKNLDSSAVKIVLAVTVYLTEHPDSQTVLQYLVEKHNVLYAMIEILPMLEVQQLYECLEIIKRLQQLSFMGASHRKKMVELTTNLLKSERQLTAVHIASWILQRFNDSEDNREIEENILAILKTSIQQKEGSRHHHLKLMLCCTRSLPSLESKRSEALQFLCSHVLKFDETSPVNSKILLASLDATTSILSVPKCQYTSVELTNCMRAVCSVLSNTGARYQVISKALICLLEILKQLKPLLEESKEERSTIEIEFHKMKMFLPEKLMNLKWEIRDSALEFIGNLASLTKDFQVLLMWLKTANLCIHIWQDVDDGESYVRATAICALTKWMQEAGTKDLMLNIVSPVDIFNKITDIIKHDTEAFSRRAAVDFYQKLYTFNMIPFDSDSLLKIMISSIHDLDWEVKIGVLHFWAEFISQQKQNENDIPDYAKELHSSLIRKQHSNSDRMQHKLKACGFVEVLYVAFNDCDKSVNEKACILLKQLQTLCDSSSPETESKKSKIDSENEENHSVFYSDVISTMSLSDFIEKFPALLQCVNLDEVLENIVNTANSCENNLESLLDDILLAMGLAIVDVANQDDENNAAAIDCY